MLERVSGGADHPGLSNLSEKGTQCVGLHDVYLCPLGPQLCWAAFLSVHLSLSSLSDADDKNAQGIILDKRDDAIVDDAVFPELAKR